MGGGSRGYARIDKADREAIQNGLDKRRGCREIARSIGRSPAAVTEEVRKHRTWKDGERRGEAVPADPEGVACAHLREWPWTCNGCMAYRKSCGRRQRMEYRASLAQAASDRVRSESRRGINRREEDFERIAFAIRSDILDGKSPEQVCMANPHLGLAPSTLYRWAERGYFSMSPMDFRRKVGYKPRAEHAGPRPTSHGADRSYAAFCALAEAERAGACEMDTVIGRARDARCLLTLYLRPCKAQLALLLPRRAPSAVAAALGSLERSLGRQLFERLFGVVLTGNGAEFSDTAGIEASALGGGARCRVYYCDVRQSQQKGACERNHVELRKMLPKRRGISFDDLDERDCAFVMSHVNSQPRPSLMGLSPLQMLRAADPVACEALEAALGMEEVPFDELALTLGAVNGRRGERGLGPLA
ncbi:IS30 family transposase [Adlercreutzia sp. ZJ242]|uniref:IS30 family transposase n=1 Tax=Adlercreutzia sp. ZJ242 TaxID=2709409 RepID=UPI0013EA51CF|nr:IS30 family transposase [Adlercreutzia sp. ZJ242]